MIASTIEWHKLSDESAPDALRILFITAQEDWVIGSWDSDHNSYSDDFSQPIYDIILWAYIPRAPHTGYEKQGFACLRVIDWFVKRSAKKE